MFHFWSLLVVLVVDNASIANNVIMNKEYIFLLGKRIKFLREERKLTQDDLGVNGVSRSMISLIETAQTDVTVSKLKIIADNLGVKVKDLFEF